MILIKVQIYPKTQKATIFHNNKQTNITILDPDMTSEEGKENIKHIYITITSQYLNSKKNNKVTNTTPYVRNNCCLHEFFAWPSWPK